VEELIKSQTWWLSIAILVSAWIITSAVHRAAARIFYAVVTFRTTLSSELSSLAACVVVAGLDAGEEIGMWRIGPGARRVRRDAKCENGRTKRSRFRGARIGRLLYCPLQGEHLPAASTMMHLMRETDGASATRLRSTEYTTILGW
jgi:hypothetical protein